MPNSRSAEQAAVNGRAVLYAKLARVMGSVSRIPKSGYNEHFKYKFAADADVSDLIRVELAKEGVAFFANMLEVKQELLTFTSEYQGKTSSKQQLKTTVTFEFTFACGETGATKTCIWQSEAMDTQDKGINKAATAAVKYFLLKTFLISTGDIADDPDGDAPFEDKAAPNGKSRRISAPAPEPTPEPPPAEPKPGTAWTDVTAMEWVNKQIEAGHSDTELRTALLIESKWSEWDSTVEDADKALDNYIKAQMELADQDNKRLKAERK